ncbi:glycosyltransferase family 4 protein [Neobacillus sp. NPDC058068]|uniref:glycosyltransferase family 4 protein n=1 Tax=Neobacillus sp. NPDC058068 TaxID=3346325 RepID=UPI0036DE8522
MMKAFLAASYAVSLYIGPQPVQKVMFNLCVGKKNRLAGGRYLLGVSCRLGKQKRFLSHLSQCMRLDENQRRYLAAYAWRNLGLYNQAWMELKEIDDQSPEIHSLKSNTLYNARNIEELIQFSKEIAAGSALDDKQKHFLIQYSFRKHGAFKARQLSEVFDDGTSHFKDLIEKYKEMERRGESWDGSPALALTLREMKDEPALNLVLHSFKEGDRSPLIYHTLIETLKEIGLKKKYLHDVNLMIDEGFLPLTSKDALYLLTNCRGFHDVYDGRYFLGKEDDFSNVVVYGESLPEPIFKSLLLKLIDPLIHSSQPLPFNEKAFKILSSYLKGKHKWDCLEVRWYLQRNELEHIDDFINPFPQDKQLKLLLYVAKYCHEQQLNKLALIFGEKAYQISQNHEVVLRRLIASHHRLGNVSERYYFIKKLKKLAPHRLFKKEYEMALDEYLLQKNEWNWSRKSKNIEKGKTIVHVLNKSLPEVNGYTIRSSEMVEHQKNSLIHPVVITKLGYSFDSKVVESIGREIHNGIEHYRLMDVNGSSKINEVPMSEYFRTYADHFARALRQINPALIHTASNFQNALPALKVAQKYQIPSVYEVRGLWHDTQATKTAGFENSERYLLHEKYELICCHTADRVVAISQSLREHLINKGIPEEKIYFVPNGVDVKKFKPQLPNTELQKKFDLENKLVIGFIGSVTHYEGLDYLLKALAELKKMAISFSFLLVGDGKALPDLKQLARELQLEAEVIFVGRVPHHEVKDYYSVIDVFPFPRTKAKVCQLVTPLKPFEAMAMGKLVLVSDIPALREMVIDGETGLVFKAEDVSSLVECLQQVENSKHLAKQGRKWVVNNRAWDQLARIYHEIYQLESAEPVQALEA